MYIFRIVDMINYSKAWYKGEEISPEAYANTSLTDPYLYPVAFSGSHGLGESVEYLGYIYTSLKEDNSDNPANNYVGLPVAGNNSWIRSDFANKTKMSIPSSGGITESLGNNISGTLKIPIWGINTEEFVDHSAATCVLLCGVIGSSAVIRSSSSSTIIPDDVLVGNPEICDLAVALTLSLHAYPYAGIKDFPWAIYKALNASSTWCSGAYIGSWSYLGVTQWTNHKKQINDYSMQDQDEWGNYSLSKRRTGRTYSAEVILKPREGALETDYDYSLQSLCFSIQQLLLTAIGTCSAFYFNNQDIGVPWIPHNTPLEDTVVQLIDSDIIVGVLQSFEISDIQGDRAVLKLSINSVPNEYKNYGLEKETDVRSSAPQIDPNSCVSLVSAECYLSSDDSIIDYEDTITFSASVLTNCFYIVPTPLNSIISVYSIETYDTSGLTMTWVWDDDQEGYIVTTEGDKLAAKYEYEIVPYSSGQQKIIIKVKTTGSADNYIRVALRYWDADSNTYSILPYFRQFYIQTSTV